MGRTTIVEIDDRNHVKRVTRPGVLPVNYSYDAGRLARVTSGAPGAGRVLLDRQFFPRNTAKESGYTRFLRAGSLAANGTTTVGVSTEFLSDSFGRVLNQTTGGATTTSTWDPEGELLTLVPPGKPSHNFVHTPTLTKYWAPVVPGVVDTLTAVTKDQDRRLRKVSLPDGDSIDYLYHPTTGKLQKITSVHGSIDFAYQPVAACAGMICPCAEVGCAPGRLSSATGPNGVKLDFGYLGPLVIQNKTSKSVGASDTIATATIDWEYDNDLRQKVERVRATAELGTPAYDTRSPRSYNSDGQLTCVEANATGDCDPSAFDAQSLSYDATSGFLTSTKLGVLVDSYTYTPFGELKEYEIKNTAPEPDVSVYKVTYDSPTHPRDYLGRVVRKTEARNGSTQTFDYTYDAQGRLSTVTDAAGTRTYNYDANGNRQLPGAAYDAQDRLIQADGSTYDYSPTGALKNKASGSTAREFRYDNFGNLRHVVFRTGSTVTKTIEYLVDAMGRRVAKKVDGVLSKQYVYRNKLQLAAELDVASHSVRRFWYTTKSGAPDLMEEKTGATSVLYRIVSDQLGSPQLVMNAATGAIVADLSYDEWGAVAGSGRANIPVGFAGGLDDGDVELLRFGARDYDARVGRWANKDPELFAAGQSNLFEYVNSDPTNRMDPTGLWGVYLWDSFTAGHALSAENIVIAGFDSKTGLYAADIAAYGFEAETASGSSYAAVFRGVEVTQDFHGAHHDNVTLAEVGWRHMWIAGVYRQDSGESGVYLGAGDRRTPFAWGVGFAFPGSWSEAIDKFMGNARCP